MIGDIVSSILHEAAAGRASIVPWTVDRYHRAIETGLLPDDTSIELIDGLLVRKDRARAGDDPMTIGDRHRVVLVRLAQQGPAFERLGCYVQTQQPISLPPLNEPEPDAAVIRGAIDEYLDHAPGPRDVLCVIEVSDSSLRIDLGPKLAAYAAAGIPQYIVVDLVSDRVLVHREPAGTQYSVVAPFVRGQTVDLSTGAGELALPMDRLLP